MKIVFLAPFGIRPKGTLLARMIPLAAALQELGHRVTIVAPPYTNPEDSGKEETVGGVVIRNVRLGSRNKLLAVLQLSLRMFRAARREQADMVHLFKPKGYGGMAAILQLSLRRMGVKMPQLLVDSDDWEGEGGMNALQNYSAAETLVFSMQENYLLAHASGVTVASRALQTKAWGMGIPPGRVLYLPNCVDDIPASGGLEVRQRHGIPADAPVVLLYTRFFEFSQEKLYFLFSEISRDMPEVRFLVIGKGRNNEESLLVEQCRLLGCEGSLVMAGWQEPEDIPSYLAAADLALYPFSDTLVNRSKCPAKLTEILRAGVPVVADGVGQLAEYIKPGVSGVLCDPDNWREMVDQALKLLRDRSLAVKMGAEGRRYLLESFSWKKYAVKLDSLYLELQRSAGEHTKDATL